MMLASHLPVLLLLYLTSCWLYPSVFADSSYIRVPCNASTTVCECPQSVTDGNGRGVKVNVCVFELEVIRLYTFTSYRVDPASGRISTRGGGKVWYIDDTTGALRPYPMHLNNSTTTSSSNDPHMTAPLTVDGNTFRSLYTINGQVPGPTLIVSYNQTVIVNVTNSLHSDTISLHWHGLHQKRTNWMDGVESVTQCGIAPGTTFTYIFQAMPSGSFWYHSHTGSTRADGVYGALIIRETDKELINKLVSKVGSFQDLPQQHTLLLNDFYKEKYLHYRLRTHSGIYIYNTHKAPDPSYTPQPVFTFASDGSSVGGIPFWSGLINGKGRHPKIDYIKTRLSIFTVSPSSQYRFRVIGAITRYGLKVSVDEHHLIIVATDGVLVEPTEVDYLFIHAGERYDFILKTKTLNELNKTDFVIRAETLEKISSNNDTNFFKNRLAEAILHYTVTTTGSTTGNDLPSSSEYSSIINNSIPVADRCTSKEPCIALNCFFKLYPPSYNLSCLHVHQLQLLNPLPDKQLTNVKPDQYMISNWGFEGSGQTSSANGRKLKLPAAPLYTANNNKNIVDYCTGIDNASYCNSNIHSVYTPRCICTQVHEIPPATGSVQFVFAGAVTNFTQYVTSAHPVHLHGHYFQVVDIQHGGYSPDGKLISSNKDINCGEGNIVCSMPLWSAGKDYAIGKTGKVSNKAPLKDSIVVPAGGYVVAYLLPNNPGYWFLHCHISDHLLEGMGYIIEEGNHSTLTPPPKGMPSCGNFKWNITDYYNQLADKNSNDGHDQHGECGGLNINIYYWMYGVFLLYVVSLICIQIILLIVCCKRFC